MQNKKTNKRKGGLLVLSAVAVVGSSLAFFTDHKVNTAKMQFGTLNIETLLGDTTGILNLAPGDTTDVTFEVENTGTLDAIVRHRVEVITKAGGTAFKTGDITLKVGAETLDVIGKEAITTQALLASGAKSPANIQLVLADNLGNEYQETGFTIRIITEAVQDRNHAEDTVDWTAISSFDLGVGNGGNTVPGA